MTTERPPGYELIADPVPDRIRYFIEPSTGDPQVERSYTSDPELGTVISSPMPDGAQEISEAEFHAAKDRFAREAASADVRFRAAVEQQRAQRAAAIEALVALGLTEEQAQAIAGGGA